MDGSVFCHIASFCVDRSIFNDYSADCSGVVIKTHTLPQSNSWLLKNTDNQRHKVNKESIKQ